jgi:hypothetical protein
METLSPELLGSLAVTEGLGLFMVQLAWRRNLVDRRQDRRWPSCGLLVGWDGSCGCSR